MPKPPFILLVKEIDGTWCYTIYTDLPATDAIQLQRDFEYAYDRLYDYNNPAKAHFNLAPMSACPVKG